MNPAKLRALIKVQRRVPIFNRINLWELVDDVAVGVDLQMSAAFELTGSRPAKHPSPSKRR